MNIKTRVKSFLLGVPGFQALCRRLTHHHVRAVMYHRFCGSDTPRQRHLKAGEFAFQLAYIAKYHAAWTPDKHLASLGPGFAGNGNPPVVITVDDGYADFAEYAFPLLQKHDLPATVFITTGFVNGTTWFWWDRLSWLLEHCPPGQRVLTFAGRQTQGDPGEEIQRWELWHTIADHLSVIADEKKEAALQGLAEQIGLPIPPAAPESYGPLSWDQIRSMSEHGIGFGAHTVTHPVLSRVAPDKSSWEIQESRQQLAQELGQPVGWFCFPQGGPADFLPTTIEQVRQAGYRGCYTAYPDPHHTNDSMTIPRYSLSADRIGFQWIMCGAEFLFMRWKTK